MMEIDLLYFDGCPSWQPALENLRTAIIQENLKVSVHLVNIKSDQEAADHQFLGSPSFQIDGMDFWPISQDSFSLNCRVYSTAEGLKGWPTVEMLRQRLREITLF